MPHRRISNQAAIACSLPATIRLIIWRSFLASSTIWRGAFGRASPVLASQRFRRRYRTLHTPKTKPQSVGSFVPLLFSLFSLSSPPAVCSMRFRVSPEVRGGKPSGQRLQDCVSRSCGLKLTPAVAHGLACLAGRPFLPARCDRFVTGSTSLAAFSLPTAICPCGISLPSRGAHPPWLRSVDPSLLDRSAV